MKFTFYVLLTFATVSAFAGNDRPYPTEAQKNELYAEVKAIAASTATMQSQRFLDLASKEKSFVPTDDQRAAAYETLYGIAKENAIRRLAEQYFGETPGLVVKPIVILINAKEDAGSATFLSLLAETLGNDHVYYNMPSSNVALSRLRGDLSHGATLILDRFSEFFHDYAAKGNTNFLTALTEGIVSNSIVLALNDKPLLVDLTKVGLFSYSTLRSDNGACGSQLILPAATFIPPKSSRLN